MRLLLLCTRRRMTIPRTGRILLMEQTKECAMRIFQCPKCGTPISESECSCGTIIPAYVVRQIREMQAPIYQPELGLQRFDELDLRLPLHIDPG